MDAFPAFFPLKGAVVVIVGDGEGAEAKARLFMGSPADIRRVSGAVALQVETYQGALFAFIADGEDHVLQAAAEIARSAGALVNVTDRPALCDFTTPAVIDRGRVVAAVGTGGSSPTLAARLRNDIEQKIPEGAGWAADLLASVQAQVKARFPDLGERRRFLRQALDGPAVKAALDGDMALARSLFEGELADPGSPRVGKVQIIRAEGPSDLLTLRAARALAAADLVVADPGVDPGITGMVRRDAERPPPETVSAERLAQWAAEGLTLVRLVCGDPQAEIAALTAAGVKVEILPHPQV
ncbi:MAG: siroheme synthase [Phenylobacterium zucineum]|nr:MAG: siroheme synthase [Phenylobacterium zucineum]